MQFKAVGLIVVALLFVTLRSVNGLEHGQSCRGLNNAPGICRLIYECRQAITDIKAGRGRVLCKTGEIVELVCCAEPTVVINRRPVETPTPVVDTSNLRLSEKKCHEYSEQVFVNETFPVLVPGGRPIVKRVDRCGFKVVPLIVGGTLAGSKEFPHMARLGYGTDINNLNWGCGGTIISKRYILTAGHCVVTRDGPPTYVRIGDLNLERNDDDSEPQTFSVARTIAHPGYNSPQQYNDIALLELNQDITFSPYSRPACLNSQLALREDKALATGWGTTQFLGDKSANLLKVTLDLYKFHECTPSYESNRKLRNGLVESQHMCAGSYDEEKDTCEGDSGGPLQVFHSLYCMYKIVGVTSFGKGCGSVGLPGVYARVSNYLDWIESNAFRYG